MNDAASSDDMEWVPPRDEWMPVLGRPGKELQRLHNGYWQPRNPAKRTGQEELHATTLATPTS